MIASSAGVRTLLFDFGPIGASESRRGGALQDSFDVEAVLAGEETAGACNPLSSARIRGVVRALP
jgi:hypothetical protein